jgi:hypothetical protein
MKTQPRIVRGVLAWLLVLFILCQKQAHSQCFPIVGDPPSGANDFSAYAHTITPCLNGATVTTWYNLAAGKYVWMNVTRNFTYRVSACGASFNSYLTVLNTNGTSAIAFNNDNTTICGAATDDAAVEFTAPYTGRVLVFLTRSDGAGNNCIKSGGSAALTYSIISSVANSDDNPDSTGVNSWVGHVYDRSSLVPSPTDVQAFETYIGYVTETEIFTQNFGNPDPFSCVNYRRSNNIGGGFPMDILAIRYRMRSTRTKGAYLVNISTDDGTRLFVDGVKLYDQWRDQGFTTYNNVLIGLTGNSTCCSTIMKIKIKAWPGLTACEELIIRLQPTRLKPFVRALHRQPLMAM